MVMKAYEVGWLGGVTMFCFVNDLRYHFEQVTGGLQSQSGYSGEEGKVLFLSGSKPQFPNCPLCSIVTYSELLTK